MTEPPAGDGPDRLADLRGAVRLVVELQLGRDAVADTDQLVADLEADSFDVMNIVAVLEENHGVMITEQAAVEVRTVEDLVQLVDSLKGP
jgi:acyl carrier protein